MLNFEKRRGLWSRDLSAGLVVFLVALPLCLGVALASNAPLFSGLLAGIVGGIIVGLLSGSHSSVSGPAAGLTAVVAAQITTLGSFELFLFALFLAGLLQIALGLIRAGSLAVYFPSSVIKGLLAAIGIILILKQAPHVVGHDADPEGDMAFVQPDQENTFSELLQMVADIHPGAALVGLLSVILLIVWDRIKSLKKSTVPAPLVVVLLGVGLTYILRNMGPGWAIESSHMVQVPIAADPLGYLDFLRLPDFQGWSKSPVWIAAVTLAVVASLETLLNLEAVDKLDPHRRTSPSNRELVAQGAGNVLCGLIGGLPVTSVIVRSSVNLNAGAGSKLSTIVHGLLLFISVVFLASTLNLIPLSCLAAILLVTGFKLASPALFRQMWSEGRYQFLPFILTIIAIVGTDLLIGVVIGLAVSLAFILHSNIRRPIRRIIEKHLGGEVTRIELANQVSFLNRAALVKALDEVPEGGHVLLDAQQTDYIDPDVLTLIRDYTTQTAPARGVEVSLRGFKDRYSFEDHTQFIDYSTREIQEAMTPAQVLQILLDGNERFRTGRRLSRDLGRQLLATSRGQHPLAVVLSCIDSRSPAELIFDLGVGDIFSVRVAGNVSSRKVLGSMEYACAIAGAKLVLVVGHTRCGAVTTAVDLACARLTSLDLKRADHIAHIVRDIEPLIDLKACQASSDPAAIDRDAVIDDVAMRNVYHVVKTIWEQSESLRTLAESGRIAIVGSMYDVTTGQIQILRDSDGNAVTVPQSDVSEPVIRDH